MAKEIFVNLPVKDLKKTTEFFTRLGFTFNSKFTDEKAACLVIGKNIYAMLLTEKFFKTFIKKEIADSAKTAEVINALSLESREAVDTMVKAAVKAGGKEPREPQEDGDFMYGRSFEDLDGHLWEVFFMDESKFPAKN